MDYEKYGTTSLAIEDLRDRVSAIEKKLGIGVEPVHKVGDMVVPSCNNNEVIGVNGWDIQHGSVVTVLSVTPTHISVTGNKHQWFHRSFRPATSDEIAAHEAKVKGAEWAKVTELREGDKCECSGSEKESIESLARDAGVLYSSANERYPITLWWYKKLNSTFKGFGLPEQLLSAAEFKRRLHGTIARLKAEAQAAEDAKLLLGAAVVYAGRPGVYLWKVEHNRHHLALKEWGGWSATSVFVYRHEFTLLP